MLNILLVLIILVIFVNVLFTIKEKFQSNQYQPLVNLNLDDNLVAYEFKYEKGDKGDQGEPGEDAEGSKYVNYFENLIFG
tara:strand:+ start:59 stop:298 length:240 start_codon:yes stop_codon:yes gene_type:complete